VEFRRNSRNGGFPWQQALENEGGKDSLFSRASGLSIYLLCEQRHGTKLELILHLY
jgi:hypothetical protein